MELLYKLSDRVLATIKGFEPWPATIDNVVCEANKRNVSYHVRLDGSYKSIPINVRCLKPLKPCDEQKWDFLCIDERWHEARKRTEVVEGIYITVGDEGDLPSKSWNFIAADSDYENVPDVDKANLKLSRVAHNAKVRYSELKTKFTSHAIQNKMRWRKKEDLEDILHIVDEGRRQSTSSQAITVIRFRCPMCSKKYKTRMALKKHMEHNAECNVSLKPAPASASAPAPKAEALPQCPKCFAPFRNQELLLKHMLVHHKTQPKKKNGIRDHIRHQMTTNRTKMASYYPAKTANGKSNTWISDPRRSRTVSSPEDSEDEDASLSDEASVKSACWTCGNNCTCSKKNAPHNTREVHNTREKERRSQMRQEFMHLADLLGIDKKLSAKNSILILAKDEIQHLVEEGTKLEQTLNDLKDMNIRLVTREYQLRNSD